MKIKDNYVYIQKGQQQMEMVLINLEMEHFINYNQYNQL